MLHKRLLKLRQGSRLTQKELSSKLGIARTTYSGYELGTSEPDNETFKRIADYYGVTTDYLLGRDLNKDEGTEGDKKRKLLTEEIFKLPEEKQKFISDIVKALTAEEKK